ncbi:MAG: rhodanese-like domain-containing protein [Burkholderiaceae bacterium]|nr:rhodanese-like domain-containing protein [Burkholderiaceae bacterium]MCU0928992.1 rhodanese-like domain-containing protein [Burkholderiaceae bacterium]
MLGLAVAAGAAIVAMPLLHDAWSERTTAAWRVSLDEARAEVDAGRAWLVDIREPSEHATGVAPGARLVPMRRLAASLPELTADPSRPVLLICETQGRSRAVAKALHEQGVTQVRYVQGGMSGWAQRGWPLVRPAV